MKRGWLATLALSVVLPGGGAILAGEQSVARTLSVEQTTIKDVAPPASSRPSGADSLEVVAWVDRPTPLRARGARAHVRPDDQGRLRDRAQRRPGRGYHRTAPKRVPVGQPGAGQPGDRGACSDSGSQVVVSGPVGTELIKVIASTEPIPLFEARQLSEAGRFRTVRTKAAGTARSLTVTMNETPDVPKAAAPGVQLERAEWAMCHQTIATIPTPSGAAQRTRSLKVLRTEADGGSVRCDEGEVVVGDGIPTDGVSPQNRVQRSIEGPVTREAVTPITGRRPGECRRPGRAVGSEPHAADRLRV